MYTVCTASMSEREIMVETLERKPACFVIFGKPGAGKTTLARQLSTVWKCQLIDSTTTIEDAIQEGSVLGVKAKERLRHGEELDECFVAELIKERLNSPRIKHYGYVLDCLPSASEGWKNCKDQLQFFRDLQMNSDYVINLKIPDQDLEERRINQRVDPITNIVYTQNQYNSHKPLDREDEGDMEDIDGEQSETEDEQESKEADDLFADDIMACVSLLDTSAADKTVRLVRRPEDLQEVVLKQIQYFKDSILVTTEDFIIHHGQQYVIELDANLPPKDLLRGVLLYLTEKGVAHTPVPKRLFDPEQEEEEPEGIDNEQFLSQLADTGILLPKFRWHRSRWGRYCPVELANGNMVPGRMEFAVGFLDKMYSISSAEALTQFMTNPRIYLKPPNPKIPCKVCVLGPPISGKSTLAKAIASKYNAMVINMQELLISVKEKTQKASIEEAKQEAEATTINTLTAQIMAQQAHDQKGNGEVAGVSTSLVATDDPRVIEAVNAAAEKARNSPIEITQEMYMEALNSGINLAETKRREDNPHGPQYGGWVIDGFPLTRENWASMIENNLLPDFVLNLEDGHTQPDYLLKRFTELHGLPLPSDIKINAKKEDEPAVSVPEVVEWIKKKEEYNKLWNQLSSSIKGSAIDPISLDCSLPVNELLEKAVSCMEGVFTYRCQEYSALEDDADADDDPIIDAEMDGEDNEDSAHKRKPWGKSFHFCPVALNEKNVLWPGNQETALRYCDHLYYLSSEEAKEKFLANPLHYVNSIKLPPFRALLLGPAGSGKTTLGRDVAKMLNVFHISFREYLQEEILAKMKKPPLVDEEDWEGWEDEDNLHDQGSDNSEDEELDADVKIALTEAESEIKSYLSHGEPLSEETIEMFAAIFWNSKPYKSTGFIIEGFPQTSDELRFLCSKGFYPDVVVILQTDDSDVVKRLLSAKLDVWKRKRDLRIERKAKAKAERIREWEDDKAKRKAELTAEYEEKVTARKAAKDEEEEDEEEDEDLVEYREQMVEIDQEEFVDEEEDEEEESENDALERIKTSITEKFEETTEAISNIQDVLIELQIPHHVVNARRRIPVVLYSLKKVLRPYTIDRGGLLAKCTPINGEMAKKLLDHGYKQLSNFKTWCPVKLMDTPRAVLPEVCSQKSKLIPVIYHKYIYYLSSSSAREQFMSNPERYLAQTPPGPQVPVRLVIVGPPKSGKSEVAKRFEKEYGCLRLSIGEVLRRVITLFPDSKLTQVILSHLKTGQTVPDDLCVYALERALLDVQCQTRGYILDGWPLTKSHVDLLTKFQLIPICIVEIEVSNQEILRRAAFDRCSINRVQPLHDSDSILLVKGKNYWKHLETIKQWYTNEYDNWHTINGEASQWWVWDKTRECALRTAQQIQQYLFQNSSGNAASICGLCITPREFNSKLGEFIDYCPVSLALRGELVKAANKSLIFAAEYRGKYYKMASKTELDQFLMSPEKFISPKAPRALPPQELLPQKKSYADVKALFPKQIELQGFCPVAYVDGKYRYESLIPGNSELVAEYKGKLFCFSTEPNQEKFMRQPSIYEIDSLPTKLPPLKQPVPNTSLPMLGYLEQTVATAIINALSAVGTVKPKFPFLSSTSSSLLFVAYHLKAFNPSSADYIRQKYRKRVEQFKRQCKIINYLSAVMSRGYQDPAEQPLDYKHMMCTFMKLKDAALCV